MSYQPDRDRISALEKRMDNLDGVVKEQETSFLRSIKTLIQDIESYSNDPLKQEFPKSAILGTIYSYFRPRIAIVLGGVVFGILQLAILYYQVDISKRQLELTEDLTNTQIKISNSQTTANRTEAIMAILSQHGAELGPDFSLNMLSEIDADDEANATNVLLEIYASSHGLSDLSRSAGRVLLQRIGVQSERQRVHVYNRLLNQLYLASFNILYPSPFPGSDLYPARQTSDEEIATLQIRLKRFIGYHQSYSEFYPNLLSTHESYKKTWDYVQFAGLELIRRKKIDKANILRNAGKINKETNLPFPENQILGDIERFMFPIFEKVCVEPFSWTEPKPCSGKKYDEVPGTQKITVTVELGQEE